MVIVHGNYCSILIQGLLLWGAGKAQLSELSTEGGTLEQVDAEIQAEIQADGKTTLFNLFTSKSKVRIYVLRLLLWGARSLARPNLVSCQRRVVTLEQVDAEIQALFNLFTSKSKVRGTYLRANVCRLCVLFLSDDYDKDAEKTEGRRPAKAKGHVKSDAWYSHKRSEETKNSGLNVIYTWHR